MYTETTPVFASVKWFIPAVCAKMFCILHVAHPVEVERVVGRHGVPVQHHVEEVHSRALTLARIQRSPELAIHRHVVGGRIGLHVQHHVEAGLNPERIAVRDRLKIKPATPMIVRVRLLLARGVPVQ
ncbi:hypothetical protein HC928_12355 [bacterium]|nr:hypothetical protein [bacterium]